MQVRPSTVHEGVPVSCSEEKRVVGYLQVEEGRSVVLTWDVIVGGFQPVDQEHRLPYQKPPDGLLKCPRCPGHLTIAGTVRSDEEPDPRAGKVAYKKEFNVDDQIIMVGRTRMQVTS